VWLEKAEHAGFTSLKIVRRHHMTMERLTHYPIFQEQSMKNLLAQVEPAQRDHLVEVALITARPDSSSTPAKTDSVCSLSSSSDAKRNATR